MNDNKGLRSGFYFYICIGSLRGPPTYDNKKRIGFFLTGENWTLSQNDKEQR